MRTIAKTVFLSVSLFMLIAADNSRGCSGGTGTGSTDKPDAAPPSDPCENVEALVAVCATGSASPCLGLKGELFSGCVMGCQGQLCHKLSCKEPDPEWCGTSCSNMGKAWFWTILLDSAEACSQVTGGDQPSFGACTETITEQGCPALMGTNWADALPGLYK